MSPCNHKKAWISLAHEKVGALFHWRSASHAAMTRAANVRPARCALARPPSSARHSFALNSVGRSPTASLRAHAILTPDLPTTRVGRRRSRRRRGRRVSAVSVERRPQIGCGGPLHPTTTRRRRLMARASPAVHSNRTWCGRSTFAKAVPMLRQRGPVCAARLLSVEVCRPCVWWPSGPSLGPSQGCHSPPPLSQRLSPAACGSRAARCERHSAWHGQVARPSSV